MTATEVAVTLTIDGRAVEVPAGTTIHKACEVAGVDTPTLCWAENLTPVNVCRVCVVEVEGSRALVPACARPAEEGMEVRTDSEREGTIVLCPVRGWTRRTRSGGCRPESHRTAARHAS